MRYYCEYFANNVNHVSPSIVVVENEFQNKGISLKTILDLGCGNGRNSLYLARKYPCRVVLLDTDSKMLGWAEELFKAHGLTDVVSICSSIQDVAGNPSMLERIGHLKFDVVIMSYVLQHIEPAYYPLILDLCKKICSSYLVVDVFWNPSRVGPGEYQTLGSVNWYGLTYEELVTMLAPNFSIIEDRCLRNDITVMINAVLKEGQTPLGNILNCNYEYHSGRVRKRYSAGRKGYYHQSLRRTFNMDSLECVKQLAPLYPGELDLVKAELTEWIQSSGRLRPSQVASKFLWFCRMNKVPVMLKEISRDFDVTSRLLRQELSSSDYIPALGTVEFIDRLSRQLKIPEAVTEYAKSLFGIELDGTSPAVSACCAVLRAAADKGFRIKKSEIASSLGVSTVAITLSLRNKWPDAKELSEAIPST